MVATKPPRPNVEHTSSFQTSTLTSLATALRLNPLKRSEMFTFYISLRRRLGRAPTKSEINALARTGICPSYETIKRWGLLKQINEKLRSLRSDKCFDCERKKRIAMVLEDEIHWVCQKCYRARTGKSQPKRGNCPGCGNDRRISYRHPELGNVCWSCSPGKQLSRQTKTAA